MSAPWPGQRGDREDAVRRSLVRVLAAESRNALARIELAASEVARSSNAPGLRLRMETIGSAVDEVESMLAKIDHLALDDEGPVVASDLEGISQAVVRRIAPTLRARGLVLEWARSAKDASAQEPTSFVALPESEVESLCLAFLRWWTADVPSSTVGVQCTADEEAVRLVVGVERSSAQPDGAEEARLELEVALAAVQGRLETRSIADRCLASLVLPRAEAPPASERSADSRMAD